MRISLRSWLIGFFAASVGIGFAMLDEFFDDEGATGDFAHAFFEIAEIAVFCPGVGMMALLLSENRRMSAESIARERLRANEQRFLLLGRLAAAVAHEVRNPLHNIHLILHELSVARADLPNDPLYGRIGQNLGRIDRAVDMVYELARAPGTADAESGVRCDLSKALHDCIAGAQTNAPGIVSLRSEETPAWVACRDSSLCIMLDNLLRNAVESAQRNGGLVEVATVREGLFWEIRITNAGSIAAGFVDGAEEGPPASAKVGGLGLGLYISRQIAANAGGALRMLSADGRVTATLRLPIGGAE